MIKKEGKYKFEIKKILPKVTKKKLKRKRIIKKNNNSFTFQIFKIVKGMLILFHIVLFVFFNLYLLYKIPGNNFFKKNSIFFIKQIDEILETIGNESLQNIKKDLYEDINKLEKDKNELQKKIETIDKKLTTKQEKSDNLQKVIDQQKSSLKDINNKAQNESKNDTQKQITEPTQQPNTEEQNSSPVIPKKLEKKYKKIKKKLKTKEKINQYILIIITITLTFIFSISLLIFFNKIKILGYEKN